MQVKQSAHENQQRSEQGHDHLQPFFQYIFTRISCQSELGEYVGVQPVGTPLTAKSLERQSRVLAVKQRFRLDFPDCAQMLLP